MPSTSRYSLSRSSNGKTATVVMRSSVAARKARTAISPRLATRILRNIVLLDHRCAEWHNLPAVKALDEGFCYPRRTGWGGSGLYRREGAFGGHDDVEPARVGEVEGVGSFAELKDEGAQLAAEHAHGRYFAGTQDRADGTLGTRQDLALVVQAGQMLGQGVEVVVADQILAPVHRLVARVGQRGEGDPDVESEGGVAHAKGLSNGVGLKRFQGADGNAHFSRSVLYARGNCWRTYVGAYEGWFSVKPSSCSLQIQMWGWVAHRVHQALPRRGWRWKS